MKGYRKVLIAVKDSRDLLRQGLRVAEDEKCWVTVVKVIPPHDGSLNLTAVKNIEDLLDNGARKATAEINEIAETEKVLVKTRIEEGEVHEKILEVAEDEDCDLIIMGQNKTNWIKRLFGRNIVEKIINQAPCPVLVVGT